MTYLTAGQADEINRSIGHVHSHPYDVSSPDRLTVSGATVAVYTTAEDGLVVSVDLSDTRAPLEPQPPRAHAVPMKVLVQGAIVAHWDEHGVSVPTGSDLLDEAIGITHQGYSLTRVYLTPQGHKTVRIKLVRNFYVFQSYAVAELLTDAGAWTQIVSDPPSGWHDITKHLPAGAGDQDVVVQLDGIAGGLYGRLLHILGEE